MSYLKASEKGTRIEAAKSDDLDMRFIHNFNLTTRTVGECKERVYQNQFTVTKQVDKSPESSKCKVYATNSAKLILSSATLAEAQECWNELKKQVDGIFTDQTYVFEGLPIVVSSLK